MKDLNQRPMVAYTTQRTARILHIVKVCSVLLVALCLSCSTNGKGDQHAQHADGSWFVTIKGKVGYPQQGQIVIQELRQDGTGWQDTIQLNKDYTFAKRVRLKEPGYYR